MRLFSQDTKVEALKRAPLFDGLSRKELTQIARASEDLEITAGTKLCREGDIGHEFFVIVDGEVEVSRNGKPVALRGGGEFFGEIALLEDVPRVATVTAKTPLRVFVLTDSQFRDLLADNPGVERKVLRALARRVVDLSGDPTLA
jgi:CRP/FNR family transcriptional regulator, cyclic AMP receptor protein